MVQSAEVLIVPHWCSPCARMCCPVTEVDCCVQTGVEQVVLGGLHIVRGDNMYAALLLMRPLFSYPSTFRGLCMPKLCA